MLEFGNRIGSRVRIHSGCFLELVTIEDDVFVGPNVVFTDDPHPMGCPRYEDCKGGATVRRLARIGANSTILPGVEIGEGSLVGAGSVVVQDVPAGAVVAGSPARVIKMVAELDVLAGLVRAALRLAAVPGARAVRPRRGVRGGRRAPPRPRAVPPARARTARPSPTEPLGPLERLGLRGRLSASASATPPPAATASNSAAARVSASSGACAAAT